MRTLAGKRKYLRANCTQIAKFANLAKNCAPQGRKYAQKLRAKAKFAPRMIAIFFRDCLFSTLSFHSLSLLITFCSVSAITKPSHQDTRAPMARQL